MSIARRAVDWLIEFFWDISPLLPIALVLAFVWFVGSMLYGDEQCRSRCDAAGYRHHLLRNDVCECRAPYTVPPVVLQKQEAR